MCDDSDDDSDDSSVDSDASYDTVELVIATTHAYGSFIYKRHVDPSIDFDAPPLLIRDISPLTCLNEFRFRKEHLQLVSARLWEKMSAHLDRTYEMVKVDNRYTVPFETCLMFLLYRLSVPRRIHPDMEVFFHVRKSKISAALITFVDALFNVALPYLSEPSIFHERFPFYASLIERKSMAINKVWGFIDGTLRKTCRPIRFQHAAYSGHKRCHGIKFQSVVTPDGLIACLYGPIPGARHDSYMLAESELLFKLQDLMPQNQQQPIYALYGDPAYPQSSYIIGGYRNPVPNTDQAHWNTAMSKVRICVEWGFKEIIQYWTFLDFRRRMKIFKFPVAKYYMVGAFLTNIRNCFYDNEIAQYFNCDETNGKLSLDEYLDLVHE